MLGAPLWGSLDWRLGPADLPAPASPCPSHCGGPPRATPGHPLPLLLLLVNAGGSEEGGQPGPRPSPRPSTNLSPEDPTDTPCCPAVPTVPEHPGASSPLRASAPRGGVNILPTQSPSSASALQPLSVLRGHTLLLSAGGCLAPSQLSVTDGPVCPRSHGAASVPSREPQPGCSGPLGSELMALFWTQARQMFEGEVASLEALRSTGTVRAPRPIKVIDLPGGGAAFVMEHLKMRSLSG